MVLLAVCSLWAFAAVAAGGEAAVAWTAFGIVLAVGSALTCVERVLVAVRRLP
jgi:hypothetical protein